MLSVLRRLQKDRRGVSAIEFALLAPILLLMFFGMVELSMAIMTQRRASHGDAAMGDLVSQYGNPTYISGVAQGTSPVNPAMTFVTMNDIFTAADLIIEPYPIAPYLTRVSSIVVDPSGVARIAWSCAPSSQSGTPTASSFALTTAGGPWKAAAAYTPPAGLLTSTSTTTTTNGRSTTTTTLTPGDTLIMAESAYPYTSSLKYFLKSTINFNNTFYFRARASMSGVGFYAGANNTAWNGVYNANSVATSATSNSVTCSYQTGVAPTS